MDNLTKAKQQLSQLDANEALAVLEALENKRQKQSFIRYWQPYDKQAALVPKFTDKVKVFGILGGNRSGKTELGAALTVAWFLGKDYFRDEPAWSWVKDLPIPSTPRNIWVVGLDFQVLKNVIWHEKLITGRLHPPFLPSDPQKITKRSDADFQIFGADGSILTCKSADSGREKFQGASCDFIWIDEEPEEDIYNECFQRTADCAGRILVTLTPLVDVASGVRTPWVFNLYEDFKSGAKDIHFEQLSVLDNPFVPALEKDRLKEKWAGHFEEDARLYGKFVRRSGLVYPMWDRERHLVKPARFPSWWRKVVSIDPAATGVTAVLWCAIDPRGNLYFYREYYERDKVVSEHCKDILAMTGGETIDAWFIDPKWGASRNAETHKTGAQLYRESGIPVRLASPGEDYGQFESREYLNAALDPAPRHPFAKFTSDLEHFQDEIKHYTWDIFGKGDKKGLSKEKPIKRNDHLMNAFQYICGMRPGGRPQRQEDLTKDELRDRAKLDSYT